MKKFEKAKSLVELKVSLNRQEADVLSPLAARNAQGGHILALSKTRFQGDGFVGFVHGSCHALG